MPKKIEISHRTIVFTVLFLGLVWFLLFIRDILLQVFVALLIMTILNPTVTRLQKKKVPRAASVLIVYFLVVALLIFTIGAMIPPLIEQTTVFASSLPRLLEDLHIPIYVVDQVTVQLTESIGSVPAQIIKISVTVFSNVVSVLTVLFFALYFLLARNKLDEQLKTFLSSENTKRVDKVISALEKELGGWARAQLILMLMVGVSTYIGLIILGVPFALPLAILAGILELVPNIGPILAAIPAVLVGFGVSPLTGLAVGALAFLIQQIEVYIFVPKIMEKSANVSPIATLLSLLIGFRVAGIVGAALSVPVFITAKVILKEFVFKK